MTSGKNHRVNISMRSKNDEVEKTGKKGVWKKLEKSGKKGVPKKGPKKWKKRGPKKINFLRGIKKRVLFFIIKKNTRWAF